MSLQVNISANDEVSPVLTELLKTLEDPTELNQYIASSTEAGTRMYLRDQAKTRHATANKLGATPTGYLQKRAELVQAKGNQDGVDLNVTGAIFRRVLGPVTIRPREKKMLAIPWRAESYGKRPGEFADLFVYRSKRGMAFLAQPDGQGKLKLLFLLKRVVVLSQDRTLLPSDAALAKGAEIAARGFLRKQLREVGMTA